MPEPPPKVVVLVSCYNGRPYLDDCLGSLLRSNDEGIDRHILVVDDASPDGSAAHVREHYPQVECVALEVNRGFAGANNAGWAHARQHHPDAAYLVLLNMDTIVADGWLRPLVDYLAAHENVGAVQPKLLLHPATDRINTAGNRSHFLGFGMTTRYGEPDDGRADAPRPVDFASGAAVMLRTPLLERVGLFDEAFYMYLEDADLSWKLRLLGYETHYVPPSVVYHKYQPTAPLKHYEHLERNRWILLLTYYRWRTLALLMPAALLMELGQLGYAASVGRLRAKLRALAYFTRPSNLAHVRRRRREAQRSRCVSDRDLTVHFAGRVHLPTGDPFMLRAVANPCLAAWWSLVRRLLRW